MKKMAKKISRKVSLKKQSCDEIKSYCPWEEYSLSKADWETQLVGEAVWAMFIMCAFN